MQFKFHLSKHLSSWEGLIRVTLTCRFRRFCTCWTSSGTTARRRSPRRSNLRSTNSRTPCNKKCVLLKCSTKPFYCLEFLSVKAESGKFSRICQQAIFYQISSLLKLQISKIEQKVNWINANETYENFTKISLIFLFVTKIPR